MDKVLSGKPPALAPASKVDDTWFTYPGGMESWVDLGDLTVPRPGVDPATGFIEGPTS